VPESTSAKGYITLNSVIVGRGDKGDKEDKGEKRAAFELGESRSTGGEKLLSNS
jgi:hypothetical protein